MDRPSGTFLAPVRDGVIQFPPALRTWCEFSGWNLFHLHADTPDGLVLEPITDETLSTDPPSGQISSFDPEGRLWIPADLRGTVQLGDQTVMIRAEDGRIRIFLRKVFETLGFRP